MASVSIRDALQRVADTASDEPDVVLDVRVHELVCRTLFQLANSADQRAKGSMARATRAQRIILNRMAGTRKPGTHPAARAQAGIEFIDLTKGVLSE